MANSCKDFVEEQARLLLEASDWVGRAKAADAVAAWFCGEALTADEREQAEECFRLIRLDGEMLVRRILAEGLKHAPGLSRETLLLFAGDRAEVAAPLIECSPVFDDADLLRILREESPAHRLAVARRYHVSATVSRPILASGDEQLIATLLQNPGAAIPDEALVALARARPMRPPIAAALSKRRCAVASFETAAAQPSQGL
jgi:uncharacterized protein (DUF2336 family)